MQKLCACAALAVLMLALVPALQAAEDPTGSWKFTTTFGGGGGGGQPREVTIKLKLEGDKLTGSVPGRENMETAIENGTFKDDVVSFTVTRERGGQKRVTKYTGKVSGDTIKGKIERERDGEKTATDWEAKREKATK